MSGRSVYGHQKLFVKLYDLARWYVGMSLVSAVDTAIAELSSPGRLTAIATAPSPGVSFQLPGFIAIRTPVFFALPTGHIIFDGYSLQDLAGKVARKLERRRVMPPTSENALMLGVSRENDMLLKIPRGGNAEKDGFRRVHPTPERAESDNTRVLPPSNDERILPRTRPIGQATQAEKAFDKCMSKTHSSEEALRPENTFSGNKRGSSTRGDCFDPRKKVRANPQICCERAVDNFVETPGAPQNSGGELAPGTDTVIGVYVEDSVKLVHPKTDDESGSSVLFLENESEESENGPKNVETDAPLDSGGDGDEEEDQKLSDIPESPTEMSTLSDSLPLRSNTGMPPRDTEFLDRRKERKESRDVQEILKLRKQEKEKRDVEKTVNAELLSALNFSKEVSALAKSQTERLCIEQEISAMRAEFVKQLSSEYKEREERETAVHSEHLRIVGEINELLSLGNSEDRSRRLDESSEILTKFEKRLNAEREQQLLKEAEAKAARLRMCVEYCEEKSHILLDLTRREYMKIIREFRAARDRRVVRAKCWSHTEKIVAQLA